MSETTDRDDPRLGHGPNTEPVPQNAAYLVLSADERAKGFVRPVRTSYRHATCGQVTTDRHYSRRTPGSPCFTPPGKVLVLVSPCQRAVWATHYTEHPDDGLDAWRCSLFRNEGAGLSSDLIRAAMALTAERWGTPPADAWVTFVRTDKVRSSNPGFCFLKAGWYRDPAFVPDRRRPTTIRLRSAA